MTGRASLARAAGAAAVVAVVLPAAGAHSRPAVATVDSPVIGNDKPAWAPDGRRIAFTSFRNGFGDIWVIGVDGRNERRLTTHPAHDDHAAWSPDGSRIAFVSSRDGNPEVYVMNADGSEQRRLTTSPAREYYPSWSPDGTRLVFQTDRSGRPQIATIRPDGSDEVLVTGGTTTSARPSWSPSGEIAFSGNREGSFKLYGMQPDGSQVRRLAPSASHLAEMEPSWSPDGTQIAFVALRDPPVGNTEIYVLDVASGDSLRVTRYHARDVDPTWSPDGKSLAFTRGPSAYRTEVHVARVDGTGIRKVTATKVALQVFRVVSRPQRPVAGKRFTLYGAVSEPTGDVVETGTTTCKATLGGRALKAAVTRFSPSLATCAWDVPAGARGTLVAGFEVRSGPSRAARTVRLPLG
jgi:Tol biopolymer transport system component